MKAAEICSICRIVSVIHSYKPIDIRSNSNLSWSREAKSDRTTLDGNEDCDRWIVDEDENLCIEVLRGLNTQRTGCLFLRVLERLG